MLNCNYLMALLLFLRNKRIQNKITGTLGTVPTTTKIMRLGILVHHIGISMLQVYKDIQTKEDFRGITFVVVLLIMYFIDSTSCYTNETQSRFDPATLSTPGPRPCCFYPWLV